MTYPFRNLTTGRIVASRVGYADGFVSKLVGLLGRSSMDIEDGLWLPKCDSVHMIGMRVALDLVFVDGEGIVLKTVAEAERNKPYFGCRGAKAVIELCVGAGVLVSVGDRVELSRS